MNDDQHSKTIAGFIEALTILAPYFKNGMKETYFCGAEHDIFYAYVSTDDLSEESENGQRLRTLGWHVSEDSWAYFT